MFHRSLLSIHSLLITSSEHCSPDETLYTRIQEMCGLVPGGGESFETGIGSTVMPRLTTEIRSENCVLRGFRRFANVTECTYKNPHSIANYTPRLCGISYCS